MSFVCFASVGYGGFNGNTLTPMFVDPADTAAPVAADISAQDKSRESAITTCPLGAPFQAGESLNMQSTNRKKVFARPICGTSDPSEWLKELGRPDGEYLVGKFRFLSDVGEALKIQRKDAGLSRRSLSYLSKQDGAKGLRRETIRQIETAQSSSAHGADFGALTGSRLGKIVDYLKPITGHLPLEFMPINSGSDEMFFENLAFNNDPAGFAAELVFKLRKRAGYSQAELGQLMQLPKKISAGKYFETDDILIGTTSPMVSRIENRHYQSGIYCGTLYSIAHVCGYRTLVSLSDLCNRCPN